jgi:hypothetical protein
MRNGKWLFVNGCECQSPISSAMGILNVFQHGMTVSVNWLLCRKIITLHRNTCAIYDTEIKA